MRNPIILKAIENFVQKDDNQLNIINAWDSSNEFELKESNQCISDTQRRRILYLFYIKNQSRSKIAQKLCVSYPTVWRILRNSESFLRTVSTLFCSPKERLQKWRKAKEKIIEYIKAQSGIFKSTSVKHYIKTETGMDVSKQSIASFMIIRWD